MLLHASKETVVEASLQSVFDVVTDLTRHPDLAGSGEVLRVRKQTKGPIGVGTRFEADEDIPVVVGRWSPTSSKLVAESEVLEYDPPHTFTWKSAPQGQEPRKLQWWFRLSPDGRSTRVVHEVEVDFGPMKNLITKVFLALGRRKAIERGMEQTLNNLRQMVNEHPADSPGGR